MIRAFVAIRPPDAVCETLEELQADLEVGRPIAFENLHLTLVFLGQHSGAVIEDFAADLRQVRAAPFDLTLSGVGVFGNARPRSVHVAVASSPNLTALQDKIARAAARVGMGDGRKFTPHVTLARFDGAEGRSPELREWLASNAGFRAEPFHVGEFSLVRSELTRSGPIYTCMARYAL